MRILFVLENYYPHIGGVEVVFKTLCEGLVQVGHEINVVTHKLKGAKRFETIGGVNIYRIHCIGSRYLFTFFALPKVISLAKHSDIIHTTTFNGAPPAWLASKLTRKPVVLTVHEVWVGKWKELTEMNWFSAKIHDLLERLIYLLNFNKYICVSKSTQNQLLRIGTKKEKTKVIYNGVDYKHWDAEKYKTPIKEKLGLAKNFVYLFTGRPGVSKGLDYLLKAVPKISEKIPNSKLLAIVSKDKAYMKGYRYLLKQIKHLGIEDRVIIHDPAPYQELPAYVKAADCIVVPSLTEGFGFVAAEACAMGKPVVATDNASLPEVVSGRFVLVKPKSEESIAEGVIKVFNGEMETKPIKRFTIEAFIKAYTKLYHGILSSG